MEVIKLEWQVVEGHFGNGWFAPIKNFDTGYSIWIDRTTGKTISSGTDRKHNHHNSVDEAKSWCQTDFESNVLSLIKKKECNHLFEAVADNFGSNTARAVCAKCGFTP